MPPWASLVAQMVKNLLAMQDTWVQSLACENLLEKGMATHSSVLAGRIPWTEETGRLQSMGLQRIRHDWVSNTQMHTHTNTHICIHACTCLLYSMLSLSWDAMCTDLNLVCRVLVFMGLPGIDFQKFKEKFLFFLSFYYNYYFHLFLLVGG